MEATIESSFKGTLVRNADKIADRKSIIICGPTRGGTSFAASVFFRLGVPFTRDPDDRLSPRLEHADLKHAFQAQDWKLLANAIEDFRYLHPVWGWKLPAIEGEFATVAKMIPDAHAVMIFKEPLSVATRKATVRQKDALQVLRSVIGTYDRMAAVAEATEHPLLLVSYDKAVANLPAFLEAAALYAGITSYDEEAVIAGIHEDQRRYLRAKPAMAA